MSESVEVGRNDRGLLLAIVAALVLYVVALAAGLPQESAVPHHGEHVTDAVAPPLSTVAPFAILLGVIAVFPLIPQLHHWWENNLHKFYAAAALSAVTLIYYLFVREQPVQGHWPYPFVASPGAAGPHVATTLTVLANALLGEFVPFIMLLFALYVISGGIRIEGDLVGRPEVNSAFLAVGGLLASLIGTTGAAMLLIRPLLETNRERKHVAHTVVFFIFVVCNCGGCLLPIGDPPLFLGYLQGVPFLWTLGLWPEWLFVNVMLVVVYYVWDRFWAHPRETRVDTARDANETHRLRVFGLWPNAALLLGVVLSVALLDPGKPMPGTDWQPWFYLREAVQLGLVGLSLLLGRDEIRRSNKFNYGAILEVAALFVGIFICMQPPLEILRLRGAELGLSTPGHFFWATGGLSSVLDNAPTYLVFFEAARSLGPGNGVAIEGVAEPLLVAVSLGAVFMGAMTYIGNGPNFMVRAIAESSGVRMPNFFGYIGYSAAVLLPLLALTAWLFL